MFVRKWNVAIGEPVYRDIGMIEESVICEELQEHSFRTGTCLLNLQGAVISIIQHRDYFVLVYFGTPDTAGSASNTKASVAVFNTHLIT